MSKEGPESKVTLNIEINPRDMFIVHLLSRQNCVESDIIPDFSNICAENRQNADIYPMYTEDYGIDLPVKSHKLDIY